MSPIRFFLLTLKRYFKKPGFLILLFVMLCVSLFLGGTQDKEETAISIAFYCETDDDYGDLSSERFIGALEDYEGLFHFYSLDSKEAVYEAVGRGEYECGYLIPEEFLTEILDGENDELITVITSPSTTMASVINETVYSLLFDEIAKELLFLYLSEDSAISSAYPDAYAKEDVDALYELYCSNGSTFHFEYAGEPEDFTLSTAGLLLSPFRGLIAIVILIGGFGGLISLYREQKNPLFQNNCSCIITIATPMTLLSLVAFFCNLIIKKGGNPLVEFLLLSGYLLICTFALLILRKIINNPIVISAFIPIYLLGCMVFTPVFWEIGIFLPQFKWFSYLFLPYYYLMFF